ncbi:hypothetical protein FRX31_018128, partial [Thalictrum thalictroides]
MAGAFWVYRALDGVLQKDDVKGLLEKWPKLNSRRLGQTVWKLLPYAFLWCCWRARNKKIYKRTDVNVGSLKRNIKLTVWAWLEVAKEETVLKRDCSVTQLVLDWEIKTHYRRLQARMEQGGTDKLEVGSNNLEWNESCSRVVYFCLGLQESAVCNCKWLLAGLTVAEVLHCAQGFKDLRAQAVQT